MVVTQAIVDACRTSGVKELVYTSTGATLCTVRDGQISGVKNPYIKHKKMAENIVINAMGSLKVNIVHPIIVIGEHDHNNYVFFFKTIAEGGFLPIPRGRIEFCPADDVAKAHVRILKTDVTGQRFVLGGEYLSWLEFVQKIARVSGKTPPTKATSRIVLYAIAYMEQIKGWFTGKEPKIDVQTLRMLNDGAPVPAYFKRVSETILDYRPTPIIDAIEQCYLWRQSL